MPLWLEYKHLGVLVFPAREEVQTRRTWGSLGTEDAQIRSSCASANLFGLVALLQFDPSREGM